MLKGRGKREAEVKFLLHDQQLPSPQGPKINSPPPKDLRFIKKLIL